MEIETKRCNASTRAVGHPGAVDPRSNGCFGLQLFEITQPWANGGWAQKGMEYRANNWDGKITWVSMYLGRARQERKGRVAEWQSGRVGESERDGEREGGLYLLEQAELEPWCLAPPSPSQSNPIIHCQPALPLLPFPVQTGPPKKPKQVLPTQSQSQTRVIDLDIDCHNIK